ncbi:hypothetical protein LCGC14_1403070 [marine sediment metagenome]|uniref:Uncharacterized protein n=1 Tax=marine sediment metagenome TaxID=412755 RepID=A0A0F9MY24_9ZZZZ
MDTKIITPHDKGCYALRNYKAGVWDSPWAFIIGTERRDSLGRKHRHGRFLYYVIRCNCTSCSAQKIVRADRGHKIEEGKDG